MFRVEENGRKKFEQKMKQILKYINRTGSLPELDDDAKECLYHCVAEKKFVNGIAAKRMVSGRIVFSLCPGKLLLTKDGLDFCWKPIPWEASVNIALAAITAISVVVAIIQSI